jgi:hypothetical protein
MGLTSALVDRARIVRQEAATAGRVRGMTQMAEVRTAWFGCMLQLPQAGMSPDSGGGRRRAVSSPTLLYDVLDEENQEVVLRGGDRIEIESDRHGRSYWEATGDPEVLASLYDRIGFQVGIRRIQDRDFSPVGS